MGGEVGIDSIGVAGRAQYAPKEHNVRAESLEKSCVIQDSIHQSLVWCLVLHAVRVSKVNILE